MRRVVIAALALLLPLAAQAETSSAPAVAEDVTARCAYTSSCKAAPARLWDGSHSRVYAAQNGTLVIDAPEGEKIYGLQLCFAEMPASWEVQLPAADGGWRRYQYGDTRFLHVYVPLLGFARVRVAATDGGSLRLTELRAIGPGGLPASIQRWQLPPETCDLLVISAHPDDELIYMGPLLPYYAVVQHKEVTVAYMTGGSARRENELLDGLWHCGIRYYPVVGPFRDISTRSLEAMYEHWNRYRVQEYGMRLLRTLRPKVVVTHASTGEYGHGAHRVAADMALYAFQHAPFADDFAAQAQQLGTWHTQKLYLHLWGEDALTFDWRQSEPLLGGKTPLEVAREAFLFHESQQSLGFSVEDRGIYGNARFGLRLSLVGPDEKHDDLFEHIHD